MNHNQKKKGTSYENKTKKIHHPETCHQEQEDPPYHQTHPASTETEGGTIMNNLIIVNPLEGMKRTFAIFLFDGKKDGFDAYTYLRDTITDSPIHIGEIEFKEMFNQSPDNFTELHNTIKIQNIKFAGQYTFYKRGNGFKEIVLAERMD